MRTPTSMFVVVAMFCSVPLFAQQSSYAGEEHRTIKSLSEKEIEQYLAGAGMGLAKAAELNHYPGPKHVLDLADTLELSDKQKHGLKKIVSTMKSNAVRLGKEIIEKEKALDSAFTSNSITVARLEQLTNELGILQGKLRFTHLQAHIETKEILTKHQVMMYDLLRGYNTGTMRHH
ncbi:MAG: hypothetical protein HYV29_12760 [Ignavibacteriales bacterium]|nr:hypothetical protein [Ignavibacteriales bacterium]